MEENEGYRHDLPKLEGQAEIDDLKRRIADVSDLLEKKLVHPRAVFEKSLKEYQDRLRLLEMRSEDETKH